MCVCIGVCVCVSVRVCPLIFGQSILTTTHIINVEVELVRDDPQFGELESPRYLSRLVMRVSTVPDELMYPINTIRMCTEGIQ